MADYPSISETQRINRFVYRCRVAVAEATSNPSKITNPSTLNVLGNDIERLIKKSVPKAPAKKTSTPRRKKTPEAKPSAPAVPLPPIGFDPFTQQSNGFAIGSGRQDTVNPLAMHMQKP